MIRLFVALSVLCFTMQAQGALVLLSQTRFIEATVTTADGITEQEYVSATDFENFSQELWIQPDPPSLPAAAAEQLSILQGEIINAHGHVRAIAVEGRAEARSYFELTFELTAEMSILMFTGQWQGVSWEPMAHLHILLENLTTGPLAEFQGQPTHNDFPLLEFSSTEMLAGTYRLLVDAHALIVGDGYPPDHSLNYSVWLGAFPVPEPSTWLLATMGALALGWHAQRRRR